MASQSSNTRRYGGIVRRLQQSLKILTAVSSDWITSVGIRVVVVYISYYLPPRELYFAPDRGLETSFRLTRQSTTLPQEGGGW